MGLRVSSQAIFVGTLSDIDFQSGHLWTSVQELEAAVSYWYGDRTSFSLPVLEVLVDEETTRQGFCYI